MRSDKQKLDALWADPKNWPYHVYYCREDPRLVVPKRRYVGGTFNFAHPLAIPICLLIVGIVAVVLCGAAPQIGLLFRRLR